MLSSIAVVWRVALVLSLALGCRWVAPYLVVTAHEDPKTGRISQFSGTITTVTPRGQATGDYNIPAKPWGPLTLPVTYSVELQPDARGQGVLYVWGVDINYTPIMTCTAPFTITDVGPQPLDTLMVPFPDLGGP